jgi:hypothetical protein
VLKTGGRGADSIPLVGVAGGLAAGACCAGLPLVGTIVGGLTVAAAIGVAGGVLLATSAVAVAGLAFRARRRRRGRISPARKGAR